MLYVLYFTEYLDHCTHTSLKIFNPRHLHLGASFMFVFSCVRSTKLKLLEQVRVPSVQKNLHIDIAERYSHVMLQQL